jgi:hypothetical protein
MAESKADKLRKAEEARDAAVAEANAKFGEAAAEFSELKDPGQHSVDAVQVGQGMGDEYESDDDDEGKASSGEQEKVADIKARLGDASDDELAELAKDDRKGVQDAVAAEQARRAESNDDSQ